MPSIATIAMIVGARRPDSNTANHQGKRDCGRNPAEI
jgi:hypothetical protein